MPVFSELYRSLLLSCNTLTEQIECINITVNIFNSEETIFCYAYTLQKWIKAGNLCFFSPSYDIANILFSAAVLLYSSVTLFGTSLFAVATINSLRSTSAMFPLMIIGRMMLGSGNGGMRSKKCRILTTRGLSQKFLAGLIHAIFCKMTDMNGFIIEFCRKLSHKCS